jgi:hypothetical protein
MTMTRLTTTSVRPITARLRSGNNRPKPAALLMLVVVALVVGLGVRFATPRAAASTRDQTYDSGDFSITLAQDGTVTLLDKQTGTALQGAPAPAAAPISEDEMRTQVANLATQVENNLGWDVTLTTDRSRLIREINAFHRKLESIPQATLDLKENAGIRTLHDIIGKTPDGECRARCLEISPVSVLVIGVGLGYQVRELRAVLRDGARRGVREIEFSAAALGIAAVASMALSFDFLVSKALRDPRMPDIIRWPLRLLAGAIINDARLAMVEIIQFSAQSRTTLREESTGAAKAIASLAPDGGPAAGYDLVKDDL